MGVTRLTHGAAAVIASLTIILGSVLASTSDAATAREIDIGVDVALERFYEEVGGGKEFLENAKGVLVFPKVIKAGFIFGGEYGEGALRIVGETVEYYNTVAASYRFQLGAQTKTVILVFMQEEALRQFRSSSGWEAGVDSSVALVTVGAGVSIDTTNVRSPIVGFVFGQKGLMYNLTLEGSKFSRIEPEQ